MAFTLAETSNVSGSPALRSLASDHHVAALEAMLEGGSDDPPRKRARTKATPVRRPPSRGYLT